MASSGLTILERVRLDKAAIDAGFDVRVGEHDGWVMYESTSSPLRTALSMLEGRPVAAISMHSVLAELGLPVLTCDLVAGAVGAVAVENFDQLQATLQRAYALSNALPHELLHQWTKAVEAAPETERQAAVKQRVGQDLFRKGLLTLWGGRCAVTQLAVPELLRASHAKPWAEASDAERLDVYNGLLLAAHLDAAFDHGFISLNESGELMVSSMLDASARALLGLNCVWPNVVLKPQHGPYMAYHRKHVFIP